MDQNIVTFNEFELIILKLDPDAHDCRIRIGDLRRQMDEACDVGKISLAQWRNLLDQVAAIQARCHAPGKLAT